MRNDWIFPEYFLVLPIDHRRGQTCLQVEHRYTQKNPDKQSHPVLCYMVDRFRLHQSYSDKTFANDAALPDYPQ